MPLPSFGHRTPSKQEQLGAAFIVMLVIMVIGVSAVLVTSLNKISYSLRSASATSDVLSQAKSALIGHALGDTNRPGELPCPDSHAAGTANEGVADTSCSGGALGRLPWKTLGLSHLRDSSGETLWYAVSNRYNAGSSVALNSDTAGLININGNISESGLVAIVFSPGRPLPSQSRSTANYNNPSHYLESVITSPTIFQVLSPNDEPNGSFTYNDRIKTVTRSDVMNQVEKVVLKQFKDSGFFSNYYNDWHAYPFAASFVSPAGPTSDYLGTNGVSYGLLPVAKQIGHATPKPYWNAPPTCTDNSNTVIGTGSLWNASDSSCTAPSSSCVNARCSFSSPYSPPVAGTVIKMTGTMSNVGDGFWRLYDKTAGAGIGASGSATCLIPSEICARSDVDDLYYPASDKLNNVTISAQFDSGTNTARITLIGTIKSGASNVIKRIQFNKEGLQHYSLPAWYTDNEWERVMYYAVSSNFLPGGNHTCTPNCLSLGGLPVSAVVVATGAPLSTQSHPSSSLADYLENPHATPASGVYENRTLAEDFNDKVISISP